MFVFVFVVVFLTETAKLTAFRHLGPHAPTIQIAYVPSHPWFLVGAVAVVLFLFHPWGRRIPIPSLFQTFFKKSSPPPAPYPSRLYSNAGVQGGPRARRDEGLAVHCAHAAHLRHRLPWGEPKASACMRASVPHAFFPSPLPPPPLAPTPLSFSPSTLSPVPFSPTIL